MTYKTLPPPSRTNKQVREYLDAVDKGYNSIFVTATSDGSWNVLLPKNKKIVGTYSEKASALAEAKKLAQANNSEYFVFDEAGDLVAAA